MRPLVAALLPVLAHHAQHGQRTRSVVRADDIHQIIEHIARIILAQGFDILGCLVSVLIAHQKADNHVAEGIIHGRVELGSLQIAT